MVAASHQEVIDEHLAIHQYHYRNGCSIHHYPVSPLFAHFCRTLSWLCAFMQIVELHQGEMSLFPSQ